MKSNLWLKACAACVVAWSLQSCLFLGFIPPEANHIQAGMTMEDVRKMMHAAPDFRRFDGRMEEWEYRGTAKTVVVAFQDGLVVGMDSFPPSQPPGPRP